jgi:hypothetical protein
MGALSVGQVSDRINLQTRKRRFGKTEVRCTVKTRAWLCIAAYCCALLCIAIAARQVLQVIFKCVHARRALESGGMQAL